MSRPPILPVLLRGDAPAPTPVVLDEFVGELKVGYTIGAPSEQHLLTWQALAGSGWPQVELRRVAAANLYAALDRVGIHGQPPSLMLSFHGLESSVLLAHRFWDELAESVPGDLVVGVPARDVVIFTGTRSASGLRRLRRAVDRMFFAGGPQLLSQDLLVRQHRRWEVFNPDGQSAAVTPPAAPDAAGSRSWAAPVSPAVTVQPPVPAPRQAAQRPSGQRQPLPQPSTPRVPAPRLPVSDQHRRPANVRVR